MVNLKFNGTIYFLNYKLVILVCNFQIEYLLIGFAI